MPSERLWLSQGATCWLIVYFLDLQLGGPESGNESKGKLNEGMEV